MRGHTLCFFSICVSKTRSRHPSQLAKDLVGLNAFSLMLCVDGHLPCRRVPLFERLLLVGHGCPDRPHPGDRYLVAHPHLANRCTQNTDSLLWHKRLNFKGSEGAGGRVCIGRGRSEERLPKSSEVVVKKKQYC